MSARQADGTWGADYKAGGGRANMRCCPALIPGTLQLYAPRFRCEVTLLIHEKLLACRKGSRTTRCHDGRGDSRDHVESKASESLE